MTATASALLTWAQIVCLEPRLARLAAFASRGGSCCTWAAITSELRRLVGWYAESDELRSADAYECAYRFVLERFERAGGQV